MDPQEGRPGNKEEGTRPLRCETCVLHGTQGTVREYAGVMGKSVTEENGAFEYNVQVDREKQEGVV